MEIGVAYVVAGERRYEAARLAGLTTIPAIFMDSPNYEEIALIEIAAKKEERGMLKAYEAYKTSVNPVKKEKTGEAPTEAQSAMKSMGATGKKIEALEPRNMVLEEKQELIAALNVLKGIVVNGLAVLIENVTGERPDEEASTFIGPDATDEEDNSAETTPKKILY